MLKTDITYKKDILEKFQQGELAYFSKLTPAKIKQDCLLAYESGLNKMDIRSFELFFDLEKGSSKQQFTRGIKEFKTDKFKPFKNFLETKTKDISLESAEIIAILIDFQPRPFRDYRLKEVEKKESSYKLKTNIFSRSNIEDIEEGNDDNFDKRQIENIGLYKSGLKRNSLLIVSIIFISAIVFNFVNNRNEPLVDISTKCMIWKESAFEKVPCNTAIKGMIPMNERLIRSFRKIQVNAAYPFFSETNEPQVWYSKIKKNKVEFFSAPGIHPITGKTLKAVTPHIIERYVPIHDISEKSLESLLK